MALFPKIDQPCPLGIDEQKRIDGYCGRCNKAVHSLTAMSESDRLAFLGNATGPVCVSYRVNVRRSVGAGLGAAALALSMAGPLYATDAPQILQSATGGHAVDAAQTSADAPATPPVVEENHEVILAGGVSNPADAEFVDEADVPELPMVREQTTGR
jgi:hypothetical protein